LGGKQHDHLDRQDREEDVPPGARRAPNWAESSMTISIAKTVKKMFRRARAGRQIGRKAA